MGSSRMEYTHQFSLFDLKNAILHQKTRDFYRKLHDFAQNLAEFHPTK